MQPLLNIAVRAARGAGDVIVRYLDRLDTLTVREKGRNDFVSDVDHEAEARIIAVIRNAYPSHAILAEESGHQPGDEFEWVIDPLDGTKNYLHGLPHFAVSIALRHRARLEQAVVFDPVRQELFTASRGAGASLDNRRLRVSARGSLKHTLIGTGLPSRRIESLDDHLEVMRRLERETAGIRRSGSAALDLAYVAAGRLDGFWECGLAPWDVAAGALLVGEAGGIATDLAGGDDPVSTGNVAAANPKVLRAMLKIMVPILRPRSSAAPAPPRV